MGNFNPRPRKEGDDTSRRYCAGRTHFNPRPRKEGDEKKPLKEVTQAISIHALVKRATYCMLYRYVLTAISIHALVKRATEEITFNNGEWIISIHALVKRATTL